MPAEILRRSLVRGVMAVLLMAAAASASVDQDPLELHVVGRSGDDTSATAEADTD